MIQVFVSCVVYKKIFDKCTEEILKMNTFPQEKQKEFI